VSEWPEVTLGELCHIARGGSPRPIKSFLTDSADGINWIKIGDATAGDGKYISSTQEKIRPEGLKMSRLVEPGDFLLSNSMSFGRPYIMRTTGCIHDGWLVLRDKSHRFDPDYLYCFLGSDLAYRQFDALAAGSTVRNLNTDLVKTVKVVLPPLEEQRRIVAVLDEAFAAIATATANAEKNIANARELLTAEANLIFKSSDGNWLKSPLGSVCEIYQPQTIGKKDMLDNGPYPVFGANGPIGRYDKFNHEEPQLLVTCRGATCGSVNMSEPFAWITGNAMVVRPKDNSLRLGLLRLIFEHAFDFGKVITGAAQPQITRQSFAPSVIAFPQEIEDQIALEDRLNSLAKAKNELVDCYERKLEALSELKQSLLHRAFTGELTGTAPDLEPA
jgi:type I restriction enzyme S subunit